MKIDGFTIDVQRQGDKTRLKVQGGVYGVRLDMSLAELQNFALLLAHEVGVRSDEELSKAEAARPQAAASAPVLIHPIAEEATHGN